MRSIYRVLTNIPGRAMGHSFQFKLGLNTQGKSDLVEYLKSLPEEEAKRHHSD